MYRYALVLLVLLIFVCPLVSQKAANSAAQKIPTYDAIPAQAAGESNPVKATPESIARAKKWWTLDCAMCHGNEGNGKGEIAKDMKLNIVDFTDPLTLKDRTDGEIFYIIKNGHNEMPAEGPRVKTEQNWDLVNYVRSLSKKKDTEAKSE